jgi:hypothetical protein
MTLNAMTHKALAIPLPLESWRQIQKLYLLTPSVADEDL